MVIFIALASAVIHGFGQICGRVGLSYGPYTTGVTLIIPAMTLLAWLVLGPYIDWEDGVSIVALPWFLVAGAISPLGTQLLMYASVSRVGISRASPLRNTTPLFASVLAILFLGEKWTWSIATGAFLIMVGASLLGKRESGSVPEYRRVYLLLPLAAGVVGGFSAPLRKYALSIVPSVPFSACMVLTGGLLGLLCYLLITGNYRHLVITRQTVVWFGLSGIATGTAIAVSLVALNMGTVVIVDPLISTTPLFTIVMSSVFLKNLERVTFHVALGAAAICSGGILLSLF